MKFKDVQEGQIFTFWETDHLKTAVKLSARTASILPEGKIVSLHYNKDCKEPDCVPADVRIGFGRNQELVLLSPYNQAYWYARRVIVTGGEIMDKRAVITPNTQKAGAQAGNLAQVYITMNVLEKKIRDMETAYRMVKLLVEENLSQEASDNKVMLTLPGEQAEIA